MFCNVGDYTQNLGLPLFGGEQPGDMYYYSSLTITIFRIVSCWYSLDVMTAFVYWRTREMGGNNVVSLIYKELKMDGCFRNAKEKVPA